MIRLALRVRREDADVVLAELLELAPSGVEETDLPDGLIEYAVYGAPGELPDLPDVQAAAGGALVEVVTTEVADDWADRWRQFHRPIEIAGRLYVRPPWEPARDDIMDLVIDPGQAFGTGAHHTTRLCLELLADEVVPDAPGAGVMDLGCGSGVLAIAAAKLGWGPVAGVDHELRICPRDRRERRGQRRHRRRRALRPHPRRPGTDRAARPRQPPAPLAPLRRPRRLRRGQAPRTLIASGLLTHEADEIATAFARHGLIEADRRTSGEWAALLLRRT